MARLTLSEQVNQHASTISALQDELTNLRQLNAVHLSTIETQQNEIAALRSRIRAENELAGKLTEVEEKLK